MDEIILKSTILWHLYENTWELLGFIDFLLLFMAALTILRLRILRLLFISFFAGQSPRSLGQSSPNFATCSMVTQVYKIRSETLGPLPPPKFGGQKHEISARFRTTSQLDCEYLRNATRHRQSENGVANYGHSHTQGHTGKLN